MRHLGFQSCTKPTPTMSPLLGRFFFSNVYFQEKLSNVNASIIMYQKIFTGLQRPSQTPPVQLRGFVISRVFLVVALSIIVFFCVDILLAFQSHIITVCFDHQQRFGLSSVDKTSNDFCVTGCLSVGNLDHHSDHFVDANMVEF